MISYIWLLVFIGFALGCGFAALLMDYRARGKKLEKINQVISTHRNLKKGGK